MVIGNRVLLPLTKRYYNARYRKVLHPELREEIIAHNCYCEEVNSKLHFDDEKIDPGISLKTAVPSYDKHVMLISDINRGMAKKPGVWKNIWESRIENNTTHPYDIISKLNFGPGVLFNAISITSSLESFAPTSLQFYDFLVMPDMRYYRVKKPDIEKFSQYINSGHAVAPKLSFSDYLSGKAAATTVSNNNQITLSLDDSIYYRELKNDAWLFVCGHEKRDMRCGIMGPEILHSVNTANSKPLVNNTGIISHIGGHKFAGNILIYKPIENQNGRKKVDSLWFGKVTPFNVSEIVQSVNEGVIIENNFRGGLSL